MVEIQITENILKVLLNSLLCSMMFSDVGDTIGMILIFKEIGRNFPHSSVSKESACSTGDPASISGLGRSSGEGNGSPLQCFCLENPMDRGACQATVHGASRVGHDLVTKLPCIQVEFVYVGQVTAYLINAINIFNINNNWTWTEGIYWL